jgi:hypothetical protein
MNEPRQAWRFWIVDPSPQSDSALIGPCRGETWGARDTRDFNARCPNPEHAPPVKACGCGVYGWANVIDSRLWMRRTHQFSFKPSYIRRFGWPPQHPPRPHFVLGRISLWDAIECQPHPRTLYDTPEAVQFGQDRGRIVFGPKALAASRARIEELWIYDAKALRNFAPALQAKLSARWDIPVHRGEPGYGSRDWSAKQSSDSLCREFGLLPGGGGPVAQRDSVAPEMAFEDILRPVPLGLRR